MCKFDLEKALSGAPVETTSERKVFNLIKYGNYLVGTINGIQEPQFWRLNGAYYSSNGIRNTAFDLTTEPSIITVYANVHSGVDNKSINCFLSREECIKKVKAGAKSVCKLEIYKGEIISVQTVHKYYLP